MRAACERGRKVHRVIAEPRAAAAEFGGGPTVVNASLGRSLTGWAVALSLQTCTEQAVDQRSRETGDETEGKGCPPCEPARQQTCREANGCSSGKARQRSERGDTARGADWNDFSRCDQSGRGATERAELRCPGVGGRGCQRSDEHGQPPLPGRETTGEGEGGGHAAVRQHLAEVAAAALFEGLRWLAFVCLSRARGDEK